MERFGNCKVDAFKSKIQAHEEVTAPITYDTYPPAFLDFRRAIRNVLTY
jgi:hypothetical protein